MRKTALTVSAALLAAFLLPAAPAAAALPSGIVQPPSAVTIAAATIKATNTSYLAKAAKSLGGADATTGKLKDGTLWRSYRDGIVVYSDKRKALTVRNAMVQAWADTGWENGRFGYPVAEQNKYGTDTRQKFTGGVLGARINGTTYWMPNAVKPSEFTVTGAGWGHGVGMSQ